MKAGLLTLATLLVLVLAIAGFFLGTETGARLLFDRVPGLTVTAFQGRLLDRWQAERLRYGWDSGAIELQRPAMLWSAGCLWEGQFCLDQLRVRVLAIETRSTAEEEVADSGPPSLPTIPLPFPLKIDEVHLGELRVNGTAQLQDASLRARASGTQVILEALSVKRDDMALQLEGQLKMARGWPLDARARLTMPDPEARPWHFRLHATGPLTGALEARLQAEGYVAGFVQGTVKPLYPGVPADITADIAGYPKPDAVPAPLYPRRVKLQAAGNLDDGWQVSGQGQLEAGKKALPVDLRGHVDLEQARVERLRVTTGEGGRFELKGRVGWAEALQVEANVNSHDMPWPALVPVLADLPVTAKALEANVNLNGENYQGQLTAQLQGPEGPMTVSTPFNGDFGAIHLPQLQVDTSQGKAEGALGLTFSDGLTWDADLALERFNTGYWLEQLPGTLAGQVATRGKLVGDTLKAQGRVDLTGSLRQQPVRIQGEGEWNNGQWMARDLDVRMGDNRITGRIGQQEVLQARLKLALNRLSQLWPGLGGELSGTANLQDLSADASGAIDLEGAHLAFQDYVLSRFSLQASRNPQGKLDLTTQLDNIRFGEQTLKQLQLQLAGTLDDHSLTVTLDDPRGHLETTLAGNLDWPTWQGEWRSARITVQDQTWALQDPARLSFSPEKGVFLGRHCLGWESSRLCAKDQTLYPQPNVAYRLEQLPTLVFAPLLPPDAQWDAVLNGALELQLGPEGPHGQVHIASQPGVLRVRTADEDAEGTDSWVPYRYQTLAVDAELRPENASLQVRLEGDELGRFSLNAQVDPNADPRPLDGRFEIEGVNLALASPFVPLQVFRGEISGSGQLGGHLMNPRVRGEVRLEQGAVSDPSLPISFEDLGLTGRFNEQSMTLAGNWRSGRKGRGQIDGHIQWDEGVKADVAVTGKAVSARVEPYAEVNLDPDLTIRWQGGRLTVAGTLAVPSGKVEIEELPPQAVRVSDDTVLASQDEEEAQSGLDYSLDLDIPVGSDKLTFSGFGVEGNLVGRLRLTGQNNARGELALEEGSYTFYGQKLKLRQARLLFAGPIDEPYLDIEAIREVGDVTAGVRLSGRVDNPSTDVFSQPPMSQEQALSYLLLGRPLETQGEGNAVGEAALALGLSTAAPMTREIGSRVGIQDFQLETEGSGGESRVVASGYLTDKLSLRYGVGLFDAANQVALRYDLTEQLYLEAASGLASSLDLFYHIEFGDTGESAAEEPEQQ
ncbi:translocation/assembly module TamB domain-containing protein [Marinobacteraceae bacterium S3BR75-40.1]